MTYVAVLAIVAFTPFALFVGRRFKSGVDGAMVAFLGAAMFLPEHTEIDFPLIPAIGKHELATSVALLVLLSREPKRVFRVRPFSGIEFLMVPFLLGAILQVPSNGGTVTWETFRDPIVLPGLTTYDGVSNFLSRLLYYWLPFYLGRVMVQTPDELRRFLRNLVVGVFVYSFFSMTEQIISPQLHRIIYGYHQHEFLQTIRMGGYRPMIFMFHGLVVAMFMLAGATAAIILVRTKTRALKYSPKATAIYPCVQVVLMKSTGAIIFATLSLPVAALASARTQVRVCLVFVVIILAYPWSKILHVFPDKQILELSAALSSEDRAGSLGDRFRNDGILLERAEQRFWFGWGGYRRSEIFSYWGFKESVPDATWIILMGHMGISGVLPFFLMLCWPVMVLSRTLKRIRDPDERLVCSGTALIIVTLGFDLLLNSMQNGLPMLIPGALMGVLAYYRAPQRATARARQGVMVPA